MLPTSRQKINVRCGGCIWLDKKINQCIFGVNYPKAVTIESFIRRIKSVDKKQQQNLSNPFRRFVVK